MYNTVFTAFNDCIKREGTIVYDYKTNMPYTVLFRRNDDNNNIINHTRIFYPLLTDIRAGQLITYNHENYIVLNKETAENSVYYKSSLLKTNAIIKRFKDGLQTIIPVYSSDINSALANSGEVLSLVDGNVQMIADNQGAASQLAINDEFYAIGGYWGINNIINKDGILSIYSKITSKPSNNNLTLEINADDSYTVGTDVHLTNTAKYGDMTITNADVIWSVDNADISAIDTDGTLHCNGTGTVTATATWASENITATKQITIATPENNTLEINADDTYTTADTPTLTAVAKTNGTADSTATITWTSSDTNVATIDSTGKVAFLTAGNVIFTAVWTQKNITANKTVTVAVPVAPPQVSSVTITSPDNAFTVNFGDSKTFTAIYKDSSGQALSGITSVWSYTLPSGFETEVHITIDGDNISIKTDGDFNLIDKVITISVHDDSNTCNATQDIKVVSGFGI
jgi:hypothetical protein